MKKFWGILFVLAALNASAAQENITGHVSYIRLFNGAALMQGQACDENSGCNTTGNILTLDICWDDPTFTSNCLNPKILANSETHNFIYIIGNTKIGAVNPEDGNEHIAYVRAESFVGGAPVVLDGSPCPFRFTTTLAPLTTPALESNPARLSPSQLAVFANSNDSYSVGSKGNVVCPRPNGGAADVLDDGVVGFYVRKWNVPCANVYVVSAPVVPTMTQAAFNAQILPTVRALPSSIQALAVGWVEPAGVSIPNGAVNSVVSMMSNGGIFYPGKTEQFGTSSCISYIFGQIQNPYFNSSSSTPFTTHGIRPAMMLVGEVVSPGGDSQLGPYQTDVPTAQTTITNAFNAVDTNPSGGNVDWVIDADGARSAVGFVASPLSTGQAMSPLVNGKIIGSTAAPGPAAITDKNILVWVAATPKQSMAPGSTLVSPGASLLYGVTSTSGYLPYDGSQTPIGWFLQQGAVGSYGTVYEPCISFPLQFPDPAVFVPHYTQGQTMVEALWKSVQYPAIGVFIGDPLASPFTLAQSASPTLTGSPASLTLEYISGGSLPPTQTLQTGGAAGTTFRTSVSTASGGSWLSVTPASATVSTALSVSANPAGLAPGSYSGSIQLIPATGASASFPVTLVIQPVAGSQPLITAVANAASYATGTVAPGEIVTIFGSNLGPSTLVHAAIDSTGKIANQLSGVQVWVNGVAAPIVYAGNNQLSVVMPYEISGASAASLFVVYQGQMSNTMTLATAPSAPGIFTANSAGSGPGALDASFQPNGPSNAAAQGSTVVLFLTGEGQTNPLGVTGTINSATSAAPVPTLPVSVQIDGIPAVWSYMGGVPGVVEGQSQMNVQIPAGVRSKTDVPIVITIGNAQTQSGVTISVQ